MFWTTWDGVLPEAVRRSSSANSFYFIRNFVEMSAPHLHTVQWDEIQQLRLDLQNAIQQVQTDFQKMRSDVYPDLMRV